jgi:hypothetical protein
MSIGIPASSKVTHCTRSATLYCSCLRFNPRIGRPQTLVGGRRVFLQINKGTKGTTTVEIEARQGMTSSRGTSSRIVGKGVEMSRFSIKAV